MSRVRECPHVELPTALARRFEAIVFDWDGTAVPDRHADATALRALVEEACALGLELVVVTGTHAANIDDQLAARPSGPGGLTLLVNRGSEAFRADAGGLTSVGRRTATADEDEALSRAAALAVARLAERGLDVRVVSSRLNRRKLDLIPEPEWSDPPKSRIGDLLTAVERRLSAAGLDGLGEAVEIASAAARDAGLVDPRVTSDAKHVEIGLTDKSDAARWIARNLRRRGIAAGQVLIAGDELGPLGGLTGSDAYLLVDDLRRSTVVTVGPEPGGVPAGVIALGGGPAAFCAILEDQVARRRRGEPPRVDADPTWTLTIEGVDPLLERAHESLMTLADGRIGTRGSMLLGHPADTPGVVHSGVYAGTGPRTELLAAPRWNAIGVDGGENLGSRRILDLHSGTLAYELSSDQGRIDAVAMSSLHRPGTAVLRVIGRGVELTTPTGLQAPRHPSAAAVECAPDGSWMRATGPPGSIVAAVDDRVRHDPGTWTIDRVACYGATANGNADADEALQRLEHARAAGFEELLHEHRLAWAARWEDSDIAVTGDAELQLATRLALFHLMASVGDTGEAAVGARGLTGAAYRGHVFWDSDVYVLPFLAATNAPAARAMLEYRVRRLPAALRTARMLGRSGARFPWESAGSGEDVTPQAVANGDGSSIAIHTGRREEHIVADVAWAAAHYVDWTADRGFAEGAGLELTVQTARWWASRIELDDDGAAHIRGVIGPDEYHELVDDNAYTNVMARWTLRRAARDAPAGSLDAPERRRWLHLADALVDGYDPETGRHEQFAGFSELEPLLIADVAPSRPIAADLLLGAQRTQAAQVVKQADVLMLHYLVPEEVAPGSLIADLDHYGPRTAHGSTLSPGVHAALLARAGRGEQALELLRLTARIDLDDIGQTTAGGVHLAAMGSVWRALTFGFGGLRPTPGGLEIDPRPVPGLERLELRVRCGASRVRVAISPDTFTVRADPPMMIVPPGSGPVEVGAAGRSFELAPVLDDGGPT